ncbi:hypothetical protein EYR40_009711 [Pleurotus pulmonarius]|nr:hypothetical protein EYR38_002752 [Pleurotus pulmonarius]KAF4591111.1 hypothetical protein EYR40_009711 [Pleurotus pulmonarius]
MFEPGSISVGLYLLGRTLVDSPGIALLVQELTLLHGFVLNIIEILPLCLNLVSPLAWNDVALDLSHNKALRRLSCFPSLFPSALTLDGALPAVFVQLTHLDLIIAEARPDYLEGHVSSLLGHLPPRLAVCVVFEEWPHGADLPRKRTIALGELDRRIVFATSQQIELSAPYNYREADDLWRDWSEFGSGNTLWDEAELIIKDRGVAANEVRISSYQHCCVPLLISPQVSSSINLI